MGQNLNCVSVSVGFYFDCVFFSLLHLFLAVTTSFYSRSLLLLCFWNLSSQFQLGTPEATKWIEPTAGLFCIHWLASSRASVRTRLFECLYDFVCLVIYFARLQFASLPKYFVKCKMWKGDIFWLVQTQAIASKNNASSVYHAICVRHRINCPMSIPS